MSNNNIRELLLEVVTDAASEAKLVESRRDSHHMSLAEAKILTDKRIKALLVHPTLEQVILSEWQELFRTGYLAWGDSLERTNWPYFHLTRTCQRAIAFAERDPSKPTAYLAHLDKLSKISPIARSYLTEALECYVAGLHKAAAVLIGGASERLIADVKDAVGERLIRLSQPPNSKLSSSKWQVKQVLDGLKSYFDVNTKTFSSDLKDRYDNTWSSFTQQIRWIRNEVGHPTSIDPITPDEVHAAFLLFPQVARVATDLIVWTKTG